MMNEKVTKIVDLLFRDVAPSEEVQALREEVLNNCQDRFNDLIHSGLSEEECLAAVAESLKGMDEVLKEYPRKESGAPEAAGAGDEPAPEAEDPEKAPAFCEFSPNQIRALDVQLAGCDLEVLASGTGECTLEVVGDVRMRLEDDGTLRLWQVRAAENMFQGINWEEGLGSFEQLGGMLNRLGQNLSRFFSKGLNQTLSESHATLRLPQELHPVAHIRTTSGEITWQDVAPGQEMVLRTTSGDIEIQIDRDYMLPRVEISTTSGDAELRLSAEHLKVSSVSGDLSWRGTVNTLEMNTTSGDADGVGVLHRASMNTTSGDLSLALTGDNPAEIRVNSVSGDIDLRLPQTVGEVDAALKTVSGEIQMRGVAQAEGAGIRLQAHTVSGDLKVSAFS